MDKKLKAYLDNLSIRYTEYAHPPVFTVEEAEKLKIDMKGVFHTKNLFLKDEAGNFFLVCMNAFKRLDLKFLRDKLNAKKKLSFASSDQLKSRLNLTPGSVSIFGMIYAKNVKLVIDKEVWQAEKVGFHPNVNTSTLILDHENLEKFYNSLTAEKEIIELDSPLGA
jgi:Ala-tRNA(Pro) deacylase